VVQKDDCTIERWLDLGFAGNGEIHVTTEFLTFVTGGESAGEE
jgi:hypothetical protein